MSENPRYRYYVLAVLTLTLLLSVADRLVFSILIQDIKAEFAFSDTQLGLLGGVAFTATYIIAGFPAARLADRSVRKSIVAAAIGLWSLMTALCGAATGFWTLFLARTGVGVGEGCSGPASQSLIADYFRREELARAMGFLTVGSTMGTVTGLMAGGLLEQALGWRWAFVLMGLPGLLVGVLIYATIREPKRGRFAPPDVNAAQLPLRQTLRLLLGNKVYLGIAAGYAVQIMIGYGMAFWMAPVLIRQFGVSTGDVAIYLGLAFMVGGLPGPILGGYITDWLTRRDERWRAWYPGLVSVMCIAPLWMSFQSATLPLFLILFSLSYGVFVSSQAPILSGIQTAVEPAQRGFAVAFALFFNNLIGQAFGLGVIGWISDRLAAGHGVKALGLAVFWVAALAALVAMAIFAWTARQIGRAAQPT
ncbi:MFS transporter [Novosphingobium sp.]|uniref:spinster family MFS transporter n=1 Tax=Novosphingobium sp. TaxID=1874826 RepID=UPI0025F79E7E|nr:MFS transporter [Novosphingobium sp.]